MRKAPAEAPEVKHCFSNISGIIVIVREKNDMDQRASDQGWRQLQANIEMFLEQSLQSGDGRRFEYKPRFIVQRPERSPEYHQKEGAKERYQPGRRIAADAEDHVTSQLITGRRA
jgi:hypothetical protein